MIIFGARKKLCASVTLKDFRVYDENISPNGRSPKGAFARRSHGVLIIHRRADLFRVPLYFKSYAMSGPEKIRSRGLWSHIVS